MNLLTNVITDSVMTGDEANTGKFIIIGIVCVVLVIGVTVLGKMASKSDEQESEENTATDENKESDK